MNVSSSPAPPCGMSDKTPEFQAICEKSKSHQSAFLCQNNQAMTMPIDRLIIETTGRIHRIASVELISRPPAVNSVIRSLSPSLLVYV